jgi:hypothetical protein
MNVIHFARSVMHIRPLLRALRPAEEKFPAAAT